MTTKTIYFGAYTQHDLDEMGIEGFEFEGTVYEFKMEIYLEDGFLRIFDSCDRMLPLDIAHYANMSKAMEMAEAFQALENYRAQLETLLEGGKEAIGLERDTEMEYGETGR